MHLTQKMQVWKTETKEALEIHKKCADHEMELIKKEFSKSLEAGDYEI